MFFEPFNEKEIEPLDGRSPARSCMIVFNNFFCHFYSPPNGYRDTEDTKRLRSKFPKLLGQLGGEELEKVTLAQFYKDLDEVVVECGMTLEFVRKVIDSWRSKTNEETGEAAFKLFAPIFKKMRNRGYSHDDLWG